LYCNICDTESVWFWFFGFFLVANFGPAVHNITVSRPVGGAVGEKID